MRGRITAVGGIKEKLIGALRAGVKTVLLPAQNRKDVRDLPQEVKDGLEIVHVRYVSLLPLRFSEVKLVCATVYVREGSADSVREATSGKPFATSGLMVSGRASTSMTAVFSSRAACDERENRERAAGAATSCSELCGLLDFPLLGGVASSLRPEGGLRLCGIYCCAMARANPACVSRRGGVA